MLEGVLYVTVPCPSVNLKRIHTYTPAVGVGAVLPHPAYPTAGGVVALVCCAYCATTSLMVELSALIALLYACFAASYEADNDTALYWYLLCPKVFLVTVYRTVVVPGLNAGSVEDHCAGSGVSVVGAGGAEDPAGMAR